MKTSKQLESEFDNLSSKKNTLERRLTALEKVKGNLKNNLYDEISDVNSYKGSAKESLSCGLHGVADKNKLLEGYETFQQKSIEDDVHLGEALADIEAEIARCESEISSCKDDMNAKKKDIATAKKAEKENE